MLTGRRLLAVMVPLVTAAFLLFFSSSASALAITSTPPTAVVEPNTVFYYNITSDNNWVGNITVKTDATWSILLTDWNLSGIPTEDDIGVCYVNITLHDTIAEVETYAYQNFTVQVNIVPAPGGWVASDNDKAISGTLILSLVICFGLVIWGMQKGEYHWMFLSGFFWIASALLVFLDYGLAWMVVGLAIGLTVIIEGAVQLGLRGGD